MDLSKREQKQVVEAIAAVLAHSREFRVKALILHARVPIAKLVHIDTNTEVDINCANILGQVNTRLLRTYAQVDDRFRKLGFLVKQWAKAADINDASQGTLSSYAWLVMTVHYLQRCNPPVLPNLQDLPKQMLVEPLACHGYDCHFLNDVTSIEEHWPEHGANTQSLGELYFGFFDYFCKFDFKRNVVACHTLGTPTKASRQRYYGRSFTKPMVVQDPIERTHNLAKGISDRVFERIQERLHRCRYELSRATAQQMMQPSFLFSPRRLQGTPFPAREHGQRSPNIGYQHSLTRRMARKAERLRPVLLSADIPDVCYKPITDYP